MATGTETEGRWESNFGVEPDFAIGVEEELLLVGADGGLLERGEQVAGRTDPDEGEVVAELFKAMVESNSDVSRTARGGDRRTAGHAKGDAGRRGQADGGRSSP